MPRFKNEEQVFLRVCDFFYINPKAKCTEVAERFGITRQTVSTYRKRFLERNQNYVGETVYTTVPTPKFKDTKRKVVMYQEDTLSKEDIRIQLQKLNQIKGDIPFTLTKIIERLNELISTEKDILKLSKAFSDLAPYILFKKDTPDDPKDKEINYFSLIFNKYINNNGQETRTIDIGHKEEFPSGNP